MDFVVHLLITGDHRVQREPLLHPLTGATSMGERHFGIIDVLANGIGQGVCIIGWNQRTRLTINQKLWISPHVTGHRGITECGV